MKTFNLACKAICLASVAAFAGCAGGAQTPAAGPLPDSVASTLSRALQNDLQIPSRRDHGRSWMAPDASRKSILVYSGDWTTQDVDVYDYPSGTQVGTLTGFDDPYGGCVDAKGDVYISNLGNGTAVEYAHGGTAIINTYSPGGEPIGCSVDKQGDVAIASFSPGGVTVYAGGNSSDGTAYTNASCEYQWPMGYDDQGNLIGEGQTTRITICAVLAGATSETTLSTTGITIYTSAGTMWDGKYIALADQTEAKSHETGIVEASLSGSVLTGHGEAVIGTSCGYEDDVNPFILGKKNTPINHRQGKVVLATNPSCSGYTAGIYFWHYPKGGNPYGSFSANGYQYSVSAVSIK
jgi:WD40 repeat protein